MTTTSATRPPSAIRQCNYLQEKGKKLAQTNGWVMWTNKRTDYFQELKEFIRFHEEIKQYLQQYHTDNHFISERVAQFPDLPFRDFSGAEKGTSSLFLAGLQLGGIGVILFFVFLYVFFPLAYLWQYQAIRYINKTSQILHQTSGLYGSIAFLLKAEADV
ncbi:MAG: hypothetical protein ACFB10_18810 [Salibacteraceae bacterium]